MFNVPSPERVAEGRIIEEMAGSLLGRYTNCFMRFYGCFLVCDSQQTE